MKSIVVCVGFDDLLEITLEKNHQFFEQTFVVTFLEDKKTIDLCRKYNDVTIVKTDAFYLNGAHFNKGLAIEQGFDVMGRRGDICIWDADILMPEDMMLPEMQAGVLYGARRRMVDDITAWREPHPFSRYPLKNDGEIAGYFQMFIGDGCKPWYGTDWKHAGGCDSVFMKRFGQREWLPFDVLHFGLDCINWHGRASMRMDGSYDMFHVEHLNSHRRYLKWR